VQDTREGDARDFGGAEVLLRRHIGDNPYIMTYSNLNSLQVRAGAVPSTCVCRGASDHLLAVCLPVDAHQIYRQHFPNAIDYLWIGDVSDTHGQHLLQAYALGPVG